MIGRKIKHYRITDRLGAGGMGEVYRAQDERLQRSVAVKVLPPALAGSAEQRQQMMLEARAAAALNHPGIVTVHDVDEEGGELFIVMELVPGRTLRAVLSDGRAETKALLRWGAQIAEALAAAHAAGVVHGDVKPENVIVQPDGRTKLLDFGIARQVAAHTLTVTRMADATRTVEQPALAGTLAYLAPEQWRGQRGDARADLYSLGVMLYEMAANHRPFAAPTVSGLMAQVVSDPPPPLRANRELPAELVQLVERLLEKDPKERYGSAQQLAAELTRLERSLEMGVPLPALAGRRAVAVLPMALLPASAEDDYLSIAIADAIINGLGAGGDLLVRPISAVRRYLQKEGSTDPLAAARDLNVDVVVDGTIQKAGQRLRVQVQAWNRTDGALLLSCKHDAALAELFELQDRVAAELGAALGKKQTAAALPQAPPPTTNVTAYELYLRAVELFSRLNRWDMRTAIEILQQATTLDPRFADAWARLAAACVMMGVTFEPEGNWLQIAEKATRKALALDPASAEAQIARGRLLWTPARKFQNRAAMRALGHALRINPGSLEARKWYCCILLHVSLLEQAREGLLLSLATDPNDAFILAFLGQTSLYMNRYEDAEEYQARGLKVDPASLWSNLFHPLIPLYTNQLDKVADRVQKVRQVLPEDPALLSYEALLLAKEGNRRKAEQAITRTLKAEKSVLHMHHTLHHIAAAYAVIERPDEAVELLQKCSATGLPAYTAFRDDPHFASLHVHEGFRKLLAKLKREWSMYDKDLATVPLLPAAAAQRTPKVIPTSSST